MTTKLLEINRKAWDLRTQVHVRSKFYDVDAFRKGASSLRPPELRLVGDVRGQRLLHLQCHFGLDTLSWGRLGATPTGVDFSEVSLAFARQLSDETGIPATFVCADVQTLGDRFKKGFDIVFASYGVLCWLGDLAGWARGIRGSLRPGGRFVLIEYHPVVDVVQEGKLSGTALYFGGVGPVENGASGTYTDPAALITYQQYRWQHPVSEVVTVLLEADLVLKDFREYPYSSYQLFAGLDTLRDGVWVSSGDDGRIPYMYSIIAEAPHA